MRILIFGAGSLGSAIGGLLHQAKHDIALLGRARHLDAIRSGGLRIEGLWGEHHVTGMQELFTRVEELPAAGWDLILITVKTYDTAQAIEDCRRLVGPTTRIVSIQNGHGNVEMLRDAFGVERAFAARVITGAEMEPGKTRITVHADSLRLGPGRGEPDLMPEAERIARTLNEAGVPAQATDRFLSFLWSKLIFNCALNPLGALLRVTYGAVYDHAPSRRAMSDIIRECFAACAANGIPLFWERPEDYEQVFDNELVPATRNHFPSMLGDLENRGRTEIDSMNGAVVRLGEAHGLDTPVNRVLTAMIKCREATREG